VERNARRKTRRALAQARRDAAAKQRFLSTMSHEMRTPLHSIVVAADMAEKADTARGGQGYLPKVRAAAQTALQQVEDVLDVARDSEETRPRPPETFDARAVAHSVFLQMQPLAAARGTGLVFDWHVPAMLHGVPRDLFRVVHNLVSNAIKATEGGTVTIRASDGDLAGQPALRLDIADTGPGISETDAHHIFTDYVSGFRDRDGAGTGLGLGIVRKAVLTLGGRIDLQSMPGEGTTFRAMLPLAKQAVTPEAAPPPVDAGQEAALPGADRSCRGRNVLLIEDHATNRELLDGMLATIGCTVTAAEDGQTGLRIALESCFDLVLTDLNMPGLPGETVARCLRHSSVSGDACIIAATAKATMSQADKESIAAGGIDAFLFKPFDSARLEAVIRDALEERAMGDDTFDETDAIRDPDMLARSAQDLRQVLALLPGDGAVAAAPDLDALARMAHHAGGALLCIGHARLGHALLELERLCRADDPEGLRGMTLVLGVEIERFLARARAPVAPV
jgi:CheY-like chemotaxis protein